MFIKDVLEEFANVFGLLEIKVNVFLTGNLHALVNIFYIN